MKRNRLVAAGISTAALGAALALPALATAASAEGTFSINGPDSGQALPFTAVPR
ncbi:hypothetical protein ACPZ19_48910 [Amycolatopsis lurida]